MNRVGIFGICSVFCYFSSFIPITPLRRSAPYLCSNFITNQICLLYTIIFIFSRQTQHKHQSGWNKESTEYLIYDEKRDQALRTPELCEQVSMQYIILQDEFSSFKTSCFHFIFFLGFTASLLHFNVCWVGIFFYYAIISFSHMRKLVIYLNTILNSKLHLNYHFSPILFIKLNYKSIKNISRKTNWV